jgi:hypothetical protein
MKIEKVGHKRDSGGTKVGFERDTSGIYFPLTGNS